MLMDIHIFFFILLNLQYFDLTCSGLRQIQMIVTDEDVADEDNIQLIQIQKFIY